MPPVLHAAVSSRRPSRVTSAVVIASVLGGTLLACSPSAGTAPSRLGTSQPLTVAREVIPDPSSAAAFTLLAVENDSRCAASVTCVSSGTATVTIGVRTGSGPTVPLSLTWGSTVRPTVTASGLRLVFDSLTPWPATPGPLLPQERYTAWVTFTPQ